MPAVLLTKPQRMRIAQALAATAADVFQIEPPKIIAGPVCAASVRSQVATAGGAIPLSVSIVVSPTLIEVFCRIESTSERMSPTEVALARLVDGNVYSGKLNWWTAPYTKVVAGEFDIYCNQVAHSYRHFATKIRMFKSAEAA